MFCYILFTHWEIISKIGGKGDMKTKKKETLFIVIMLFLVLHGFGQDEMKITGKFLLPTSTGNVRKYDAVMIVTPSGICIECREKVFRLFNEFDAPRLRKLEIKPGDFQEIVVNDKMKQIVITSSGNFYRRYRNLFFTVVEGIFEIPVTYYCLGFEYTDPDEISEPVKKLFSSLTRRSKAIIWGGD